MTAAIMKTCSRCQSEKSLDDFHRSKSNKSGHVSQCKSCVAQLGIEWRTKNREKSIANARKWNAANPERRREILLKSNRKRNDKLRDYQQKRRDELCEPYVRRLITQRTGVAQKAIPDTLVEAFTVKIAIDRIIKEKK